MDGGSHTKLHPRDLAVNSSCKLHHTTGKEFLKYGGNWKAVSSPGFTNIERQTLQLL